YDAAYWVRLDRLTPGTQASVDARFVASNRIEVQTHNLNGFTLKLAGHPKFSVARPLEVRIDGTLLRPKARDSISFHRTAKSRIAGLATIPAGEKRPGLEGPIAEAVAARQIYVYGADDGPARLAAAWSTPRAHLLVSLPVKADKDITAQDLAESNLILFGGKETNARVARFA